jgi:uncharacterized protein (DUF433 family)
MNPRISIDPQVMHGRPVVKGTRVPVVAILGELAEGMSRDDVAREYRLTIDDVIAAIDFAAELVEQEQHHTLPVSASSS